MFKLVPDILKHADKQADLQKEAMELKKKEFELRQQQAAAASKQLPNPLPIQMPVLDRFLFQILQGADVLQLRAVVALNLSKADLAPRVQQSINVDSMPDLDYNQLCDLYDHGDMTVEKVLARLNELGAQNPKTKDIALLLSTGPGRGFLQNILDIVESLLFPMEGAGSESEPLPPIGKGAYEVASTTPDAGLNPAPSAHLKKKRGAKK